MRWLKRRGVRGAGGYVARGRHPAVGYLESGRGRDIWSGARGWLRLRAVEVPIFVVDTRPMGLRHHDARAFTVPFACRPAHFQRLEMRPPAAPPSEFATSVDDSTSHCSHRPTSPRHCPLPPRTPSNCRTTFHALHPITALPPLAL